MLCSRRAKRPELKSPSSSIRRHADSGSLYPLSRLPFFITNILSKGDSFGSRRESDGVQGMHKKIDVAQVLVGLISIPGLFGFNIYSM
jgi:hypothetical protein